MAANSFPTGIPVGRMVQVKVSTVARTDTAAKLLFVLPKYAQVIDVELLTAVASNAGTTAVVSVGNTTAANQLVLNQDVKTAAGYIDPTTTAVAAGYFANATADIPIYAIYAETGGASSTGGPWTVIVSYMIVGPGYQ